MDFDFPAIMVTAVFVTGVLWALDVMLWAPKRRKTAEALSGHGSADGDVEKAKEEILNNLWREDKESFG